MMTELIDKEKERKKFTAEFLTLPCTAMGQTTSSSIAEKSNIWAEHRLTEKKSALDKKLYKSMIKMNVDMLGITDELTRLKKSASSSSLDGFHVRKKPGVSGNGSEPNSPNVNARRNDRNSKTSISSKSGNSQECLNARNRNSINGSIHVSGSTSPMVHIRRNTKSSSAIGIKPGSKGELRNGLVCNGHASRDSIDDGENGVSFSLGNGTSSDESYDSDQSNNKHKKTKGQSKSASPHSKGRHGNDLHRAITVTTCKMGRDCGANRAEVKSFQNATRRYHKQLSDHSHSKPSRAINTVDTIL